MTEYNCPHCKNPIYDEEALLCHFCGESLGRKSKGALGTIRGSNPRWTYIVIALIVLVSFVLLFIR